MVLGKCDCGAEAECLCTVYCRESPEEAWGKAPTHIHLCYDCAATVTLKDEEDGPGLILAVFTGGKEPVLGAGLLRKN